jgi:hypothetical protein
MAPPFLFFLFRGGPEQMASCLLCGRPIRFPRKQHPECREARRRAIEAIPALVEKSLASSIETSRFHALLTKAAEASFISAQELKQIIVAALLKAADRILSQRLISADEDQRISEIMEAFDRRFDGKLFELLVKADILRTLAGGKIPDRVRVKGDMPISLAKNETVIWIFNHVVEHRRRYKGSETSEKQKTLDTYSVLVPVKMRLPGRWTPKKAKTDVIVTNQNLYFVSAKMAIRRLPISRILDLKRYESGLSVLSGRKEQGVINFVALDDPWFAANLIGSLTAFTKAGLAA